jgi:hypothetical protein
MLDIMIDLETMSTLPHAAITQIGAVEFDLDSGAIGQTFQAHISLPSNADYVRHIDADTVRMSKGMKISTLPVYAFILDTGATEFLDMDHVTKLAMAEAGIEETPAGEEDAGGGS